MKKSHLAGLHLLVSHSQTTLIYSGKVLFANAEGQLSMSLQLMTLKPSEESYKLFRPYQWCQYF